MGKKRKRMQRYLEFQKAQEKAAPAPTPAPAPVVKPTPRPAPKPKPIEKKPEPQPVVESAVVESAPAEHAEDLVSPIPSKPKAQTKPKRKRSIKKESKEE